MSAHGDEAQVHEDRFGTGAGVHARAHVEHGGVGHVDHRQAGLDQLEEHDGAQDLGVGLGDRAGEARRRGRPAQAERVDAHRHAPGGQQQAGVEHLALVLQRRHGAVDDREERPLRVPAAVVGGGREHVHHEGDLGVALHLVLHVLAGVLEQHRERLEGLGAGRGVVGAHRRPHEADLVESVGDASGGGDVGRRRRRRSPVRWSSVAAPVPSSVSQVRAPSSTTSRAGSRAASRTSRGARATACLDQLARQPGDQGLVVDLGAGLAQDGERPGAREAHPGRASTSSVASWIAAQADVSSRLRLGITGAPFALSPYGTMTRRAPGTMRQSMGSRPAGSPSVCTRTSPVSPGATDSRAALGAEVAHLGVLHRGAEQRRQPVAGELEERLVGEHADVEQAVAHVGQRGHAEVAAVVRGVAEHHEVAVDALLVGLDADQRRVAGQVLGETLDGEGRLFQGLLERRVQRRDDGRVDAGAGHQGEVAIAGQAEVDRDDVAARGQAAGVGRVERDAELDGHDVDGAGRDDGERYVAAGHAVDDLVHGAVAADGADDVDAALRRLARRARWRAPPARSALRRRLKPSAPRDSTISGTSRRK